MIMIHLPIDYFNEAAVSDYNHACAMISSKISKRFKEDIMVELSDHLEIHNCDLESAQVLMSYLLEEQIRLRRQVLDLDERTGKSLMRLLIGISQRNVLRDSDLMYILAFSLVQIMFFNDVEVDDMYEQLKSLYSKTQEYHKV